MTSYLKVVKKEDSYTPDYVYNSRTYKVDKRYKNRLIILMFLAKSIFLFSFKDFKETRPTFATAHIILQLSFEQSQ